MTEIRPLAPDDVPRLYELPMQAFDDLDRQHNRQVEEWAPSRIDWWGRRMRHLLSTDPSLQWVAVDDDGGVVGVSSGLRRGGLWGLSLLVVKPGLQAAGLGKQLIDRAFGGWDGAGIICASDDPKAVRRYGSAGFEIHPEITTQGRPDVSGLTRDAHVVDGFDQGFVDAVDLEVRGATHGTDLAFLQEQTSFALRYEHGPVRGYCIGSGAGLLNIVAATEPVAAQALLRAFLVRQHEEGREVTVSQVTGHQQWAVRVLLDARLPLRFDGAVCYRGLRQPDAYVPNGAFL